MHDLRTDESSYAGPISFRYTNPIKEFPRYEISKAYWAMEAGSIPEINMGARSAAVIGIAVLATLLALGLFPVISTSGSASKLGVQQCNVSWNAPSGPYTPGQAITASLTTNCSGKGAWSITNSTTNVVAYGLFSCLDNCTNAQLFSFTAGNVPFATPGTYYFVADFNGSSEVNFSFATTDGSQSTTTTSTTSTTTTSTTTASSYASSATTSMSASTSTSSTSLQFPPPTTTSTSSKSSTTSSAHPTTPHTASSDLYIILAAVAASIAVGGVFAWRYPSLRRRKLNQAPSFESNVPKRQND